MDNRSLPILGWREWVSFPVLNLPPIKAKIDTGARSSALHAFDIQLFDSYLRCKIHPLQKDDQTIVEIECPYLGCKTVRSSNGQVENRPVIHTQVTLGMQSWDIELTLTNRDLMGFRLLLGRQAIRNRYWVDPGRSFLHRA
ncbi:MAG: ATP-dependent zinc protease [Prochlorotrichaceae cyanobacterium]|jgi:hypothetical protein